ncbi:methyltransferase [Amycolatopsis pigmentata]|uniref:Methyltransferase n=1 Tax=Amycolatopsis pigmentata TaxID=450801 RepID=A0ABW5FR95_9PSEU
MIKDPDETGVTRSDQLDVPLPPTVVMARLLNGFVVSQALFVLADAGVATILADEGPQAIATLAERTGSDVDVLTRLIRSLTPHGIFRTERGKVAVTALGATLSENHPQSVFGIALASLHLHYRAAAELRHTLRTGESAASKYFGKPYFDHLATDPPLAAIFGKAMTDFARTMRAGTFDDYRLPDGELIADIGGGDGTILTELLRADVRPGRRGIVFDRPGVVESAHAVLAAARLTERVDVVAGDFFAEVPRADIYLLSWILHDWIDEEALKILRTVAAAAPAGSRLLVVEQVMPAGDEPHPAKEMDLAMVCLVGGRERTESEFRALLGDAGFVVERIVSTPTPLMILESVKA